MVVKASFSATLKKPIKTKVGFEVKKIFFSAWKNENETNHDFRNRILASKGFDIKNCNFSDVFIN